METIYSKEQFQDALSRGVSQILVKGELADKFRRRRNRKRAAKVISGVLIGVGGALAIPVTGGTSSGLVAAGMAMTAATAAGLTVTISAGELAILCGCALGAYGIKRQCRVTFNRDGSCIVEPRY